MDHKSHGSPHNTTREEKRRTTDVMTHRSSSWMRFMAAEYFSASWLLFMTICFSSSRYFCIFVGEVKIVQ
ncbi:hypothetical protein E2C01_091682 [Portunus trituberculatus]|uniref:Uncharacterized protein n=1 Tax=Portunus trituberculatus TaxID=210409 RepID=A0A5B7JVQ6_PORTR|nr:hypothetical protein [Portunus trituberculatus]